MALDKNLESLNKESLKELSKAWHKGNLTIVVGAGASVQSGLPTWYGVLDRMLCSYVEKQYINSNTPITDEISESLRKRLEYESPIVIAHYLQSRLKENEYMSLVHEAVYGNLTQEPEPGPIAKAIGRLSSKLNSIVTFNYDELIEKALYLEGVKNTAIWKPTQWSKTYGTPIYHPHGMLPYNRDPEEKYWIVLSENDYHTQYSHHQNWSNIAISRALLENTCLFVSTSITDPNLRRMLDIMHRETPNRFHYFMWETPKDNSFNSDSERFTNNAIKEIFVESHERLGLKPVWFHYRGNDPSGKDKNYNWKDIPDILDFIGRP